MSRIISFSCVLILLSCASTQEQKNELSNQLIDDESLVKKELVVPDESQMKPSRGKKTNHSTPGGEYGSIEYYLSNSLSYAPYLNLSFSLPELLKLTKTDQLFKRNLEKKINSVENELSFLERYPTTPKELLFFKEQLKRQEGYEIEKEYIASIIPGTQGTSFDLHDYSNLFRSLTKADGAGHWEISNTLLALLFLEGDTVLSVRNEDAETIKGYQEFLNRLDGYCFVAMSDDNVPKLLLERKRDYLLSIISKAKYPEFYAQLEMVEITVTD